jgi:hypothetical protein
MTMQTLDSATAHNVTGAVVRQQIQVSTVPLKALPGLLARQRAAFLRDGPPSLVERRANLKKLRAALLARRGDFEAALEADFGHRSRHETAIDGIVGTIAETIAGRTTYLVAPIPLAISDIRAGRLCPLGVTTRTRSPLLRDVPSLAEAGIPGSTTRSGMECGHLPGRTTE